MGKLSIYQSLVDFGAACGESAGILDVPYLRAAHQRRQRIIEAAGSAALDGRPTSPERLFSWVSDIPLVGQPNLGAEGYAARLLRLLGRPASSDPLAAEARDLAEAVRAKADRDAVAAAVLLFRAPDSITPVSRAAYHLYLRGCLGPAEPALSPLFNGLAKAARRPAAVFDSYIADRLAKASRRSLSNARTLRAGLATVYAVLGGARSSSKVHGIAELLFAGHPLNVSKATKLFSVSRLVARKHLLRLEHDGLAERATRSKSGAIFVARDGLMTFGQAVGTPLPRDSGPLNVGGINPLTSEHRSRLEAISDDIAERMRDLDSLLDRLSTKPPSPDS